MNREELRIKLLKFINNFSYVIPDSKMQEEMVYLALEECRSEQDDLFKKEALSALKKLIKDKINDLYLKDRDFLFKNAIRNISSSEFSENDKLKLLSILISAIKEPIEVDFYRKLVRDNRYLKDIFSPFFIDIDGNIYENDELKEIFPKLLGMYYEYIKENKIKICAEKLDPNDERRILSREEVKNLYKRIRMGDKDAKEQLIIHNMRLVKKVAYRYIPSGIDFEDLVQEGVIGLNNAIDRFDPDRDFAFSTYATHWIRQAIKRYADDNCRTIRIPVHKREWIYKISQKMQELELKFGSGLSNDEIAEKLGISLNQLQEYFDLNQSVGSLNLIVEGRGGDKDTEIGDFVADPTDEYDAVLNEISNEKLKEILKEILDPRSYRIMLLRTGLLDGRIYTLEEIGSEFNVTRERIRQIEAKACKKLKKNPYFKNIGEKDKARSKMSTNASSIGEVKFKSFKDLLNDRYDANTQDLIMKLLSDSEIELLRSRYGTNLDEFIEVDDKSVIKEIRDLIYKVIPERLSNTTLEVSEEIKDVSISSLIDSDSPLVFKLSKKFSSEEINYIINTITEKDLSLLKDAFGEQLTANMYDEKLNSSIGYLFSVTFQKRVNDAKKDFGDEALSVRSLREILDKECSPERVNQVLKSLTPNERRLLAKRYGGVNFDKVYELDDINTIAKINTLVQEIVLEEVSRRALIIGNKTFVDLLSRSYSVSDISEVLKLLSDDDKELLQARYGVDFNQLLLKKSFKESEELSKIILVKVPRLLGKEMKIKEPNVSKYNVRGLTLYEKLSSIKYSDEEISYILSSLTEEEKSALSLHYGMSLQERAVDLDLGIDALEIFTKAIPQRVSSLNSKDARKTKKLTLSDRLKEKYSEEEIRFIFNILNEQQLQLLRLSYGEKLNDVICGVDGNVQQKIKILISSTLKRNIDEAREKHSGELKVDTLKDVLRDKYCDEQIDVLVNSLPVEKKELLVRRFGENYDEVHDLADLSDVAIVNSLVLSLAKGNFSKRMLNSKSKTFMQILKENYSDDEITYILTNLTEEEANLLKLRYGESFDTLCFVSSIETRNEIYNLVSKVIPGRVEELRNSDVAKKEAKVKQKKLSLIEKLGRVYNLDEIKEIISSLTDEERTLLKLRYGENFDQFLKIDDKAQIKHINYLVSTLLKKKTISQQKDRAKNFIIKLKEKYTDDEIKYILDNLSESERKLLTLRYGENFDEFFSLDDQKLINRINFLYYGSIPKRVEKYRNPPVIKEKEKRKVLSNRTLVSRLKNQYSDDEIRFIFELINQEELALLQMGYGDDLTCCKANLDKSLKNKLYRLISHGFRRKIEYIRQENNGSLKIYTLMEVLTHNLSDEEIVSFLENLTDEDKVLLESRYGKSLDEIISIDDISVVAKINSLVQAKIKEYRRDKAVMKKESSKIYLSLIDRLKRKYSDSEIKYILDNLSESEREMLALRYGGNFDQYNMLEDKKLAFRIHNFVNNTLLRRIEKYRNPSSESAKKKSLSLSERLSNYYSKEEIECIFSYITEEELSLLQKGYGDDLSGIGISNDTSLRCKTYRLINSRFRKKLDSIKKENNGVLRTCTLMENLRKRISLDQIKMFFDSLSSEERELLVSRYGDDFDEITPISDIRIVAKINSIVESHIVEVGKSKRKKDSVKIRVSFIDKLKEKYNDSEIKYILDNLSESERKDLTLRFGENFDEYNSVEDEKVISRINYLLYSAIPKRVEDYRNPSVKHKEKKGLSLYKRLLKYYSEEEIQCIFSYITEEELSLLQKEYGDDLTNTDIFVDASLRKKTYTLIKDKFKKKLESIKQENNGSLRVCTLMESLRKRNSLEQISLLLDNLSSEERELLVSRYGESFDEIIPISDIRIVARINSLIENRFGFECVATRVAQTRNKVLIERLKEKYSDAQIKEIFNSLTPKQIELLKSRYGEDFDEFHRIEDKKQAIKINNLATKVVAGKYLLKKVPVSVPAVGIKTGVNNSSKRKISKLKVLDMPGRFTLRKKRLSPISQLPSSVLVPSALELNRLNNTFGELAQNDDYEVSCSLLNLEGLLLELKDNLGLLLKKIGFEKDVIGKVKAKKKD